MTEKEFFNRYSFNVREDKIGGGSFGTVYKAYDNVLDREVAVKVSEVRIAGDKEFSLREEFKAIEKLPAHANIANYEEVHTFESFNGVFDYAIMQYYPLGNLDSFLSGKSINLEEKEKLVLSILDGIAHLHKHKIVQRDLKPSNILVVDRRGELIPKITDFGLSKQANADSKASRFTNSFAGGTLQYCSPEQIKGQPLKLNTDLWSFGAIAYEIFTGKALFQVEGSTSASAEWQNEVSKKILHEDYSAKLKELPGNWPAVVAACLERDMNERVKDAEELLKILKGEASEADTSATQILPQADTNATQIFSNEKESGEDTRPENSEPEKIQKQVSQKENKQKKAEKKQTAPKSTKSNKKVWIGIAAGLIAAVAVTYGFSFMDTSEQAEESLRVVADEPVLFKKDSLFGYKLKDQVVIEPAYIMADNFKNDRAKVQTQDSIFYIDEEGNWTASFTENSKKEAIADNSEKDKKTDNKKTKKEVVKKLPLAEQKALYDKGKKIYERDRDKAYDILLKAAEQGYTDAQHLLGKYFTSKFGHNLFTRKYFDSALYWLETVEKKGSVEAQVDIGYLYDLKDENNTAVKWYSKAASKGYVPAYHQLAYLYKYTRKDLSHMWELKAAEAGDVSSMTAVAFNYREGRGTSKDLVKSTHWFYNAAKNGDLAGMSFYAGALEDGVGIEGNIEEAKIWYNKILEMKDQKDYDYWARSAKRNLKDLR